MANFSGSSWAQGIPPNELAIDCRLRYHYHSLPFIACITGGFPRLPGLPPESSSYSWDFPSTIQLSELGVSPFFGNPQLFPSFRPNNDRHRVTLIYFWDHLGLSSWPPKTPNADVTERKARKSMEVSLGKSSINFGNCQLPYFWFPEGISQYSFLIYPIDALYWKIKSMIQPS